MALSPRSTLIALAAAVPAGLLGYITGQSDAPPSSGALAGPVRVIDGDGLELGAVEIRLVGIDAPERDQSCADANGRSYACGTVAAEALTRLTFGQTVACEGTRKDSRGRILAVCRLPDGTDLNAQLVRLGMAVAFRRYSLQYTAEEDLARQRRVGLWAGNFVLPSCHRAAKQGRACRDVMPGS